MNTAIPEPEVLWSNAFKEPVDLDDIDRDYAKNILAHIVGRMERRGYDRAQINALPVVKKLREVIPVAREKNDEDRRREREYNSRVLEAGMPSLLIDNE